MYSLLWVGLDLGFLIYFLSHLTNNPKRNDWKFVKDNLQYQKGILNFALERETTIWGIQKKAYVALPTTNTEYMALLKHCIF